MNNDFELKIETVGSGETPKKGSVIFKHEEDANLELKIKIYDLTCSYVSVDSTS